jgi:hypothetical protein
LIDRSQRLERSTIPVQTNIENTQDPRWIPGGPEGRPRHADPGPAFPLDMWAPAAALRLTSARCTSRLSGEGLGIEPGDAVGCR